MLILKYNEKIVCYSNLWTPIVYLSLTSFFLKILATVGKGAFGHVSIYMYCLVSSIEKCFSCHLRKCLFLVLKCLTEVTAVMFRVHGMVKGMNLYSLQLIICIPVYGSMFTLYLNIETKSWQCNPCNSSDYKMHEGHVILQCPC